MNLSQLTLATVIVGLAGNSLAQSTEPRRGIEFYFSSAGGDNSRLLTDSVTSANWFGDYDVIVKNVTNHAISFNGGTLHVGYAISNGFGPAATITPGSDRVTLRYGFAPGEPISNNPNILSTSAWMDQSYQTYLVGGRTVVSGAPRPYGLHIPTAMPIGQIQTLEAGTTMLLARIAFRDNGLFASQGNHDLVLYDLPFPGNLGDNTLGDNRGNPSLNYHDGGDWFGHSRLTLMAPEPGPFVPIGMGLMALILRRRVHS